MKYIQKLKMITDNLAAIEEPITEKDQILQILGGLGSEFNLIVASLTAYEDDFFLKLKFSFVLICKQTHNFFFFVLPQT